MTSTSSKDIVSWCEERLRQPQEPLRLARLFTPPDRRDAATAIGALYIELEAIARGQRDLNVARMKLGWWRDELGRLDAGEPAHPATRLLAQSGIEPAPVTNRLVDLVTCMELSLLEGPPDNQADAAERAERNGAQLVATLNEALRRPDTAASGTPVEVRLGRGIGLERTLHLPLSNELQSAMAVEARNDLVAGCPALPDCAPAVRVLAILAWTRVTRRGNGDAGAQKNDRMSVLRAWRAARGKYPHALHKNVKSGRSRA